MKANINRFWLSLGLILVLAAGLRLYRLGDYPQTFNNDEMMLGYDAWSIWKTGADQYGVVLPTSFRSFNEYLPGLAQYITAPFVGILGLYEANARLPFALMGIITVLLTGLIGRRWFNPLAGLAAALLLAIDPWHVYFSRLALVNSSVPMFTVLALYTFTRTINGLHADAERSDVAPLDSSERSMNRPWRRSSLLWLIASALCFALLMRTYQPMKIEAPILFAICIFAAIRFWWKHRVLLAIWVALFLAFASPQIIDQLSNWSTYQLQFNHDNLLGQPNWPLLVFDHYSEYYNPSYLFFDGLKGDLIDHAQGIGNLFWLEGVLWIAAIYGVAQQRWLNRVSFSLLTLLTLWFFTYPIAASITVTLTPSENRTVNFLPLPELLAGYGMSVVLNRLLNQPWPWRWLRPATVVVCSLALLFILIVYESNFLSVFFPTPILQTAQADPSGLELPANLGLRETLQATISQATRCDLVYVDFVPWIYYLFEMQYPPAQYQKVPRLAENVPPDDFVRVAAFDNLRFAAPGHWNYKAPEPPPPCSTRFREFYVTRVFSFGSDWHRVYSVNNAANIPIWMTYEKDVIPPPKPQPVVASIRNGLENS